MISKSTTTVPSILKATKATGILTTHRLDSDLFIADAAGERIGVDGEPDRGLDVDAAGPGGENRRLV